LNEKCSILLFDKKINDQNANNPKTPYEHVREGN